MNKDIFNQYYDQNPFMEDEGSAFDLMKWVTLFLRNWYFFVLAVVLAVGLSLLKTRSILPTYDTTGTILIQEVGHSTLSGAALMQGFGLGQEYRNVTNQVVMLRSYDLMSEVVDSLPFMHTEYITMGRFRTRNLYYNTPFVIERGEVNQYIENQLFSIDFEGNGQYAIALYDPEAVEAFGIPAIEQKGRVGEVLENAYMSMTVHQVVDTLPSGRMYFRLRSKESLIEEFSARMVMDFVAEESTVLGVTLNGPTPERDRDFIDMFFNVHGQKNLDKKNDAANRTIDFIDEQMAVIHESLNLSEARMIAFRQENQLVNVSSHAGDLMEKAVGYDEKDLSLQLRETYLDYLDKYLTARMETGTIVAPSSLGLNEPLLMSLVQQLNELQLKINEVNEKNVFYDIYAKDITNTKESIREVVKSMRASLELDMANVDERKKELEIEINKLPAKELEMLTIERQYRIDDNYYTFFLQKRAETEIQKASNTPDNDVLDQARVIGVTNGGEKMKMMLMFLIVGLLVPAAGLVLLELLNQTLRTEQELKGMTSFGYLGSTMMMGDMCTDMIQKKPRSSFAESFRRLRMRIEFVAQRKNKITMLVTSTHSKDGKTYFALNLAAIHGIAKSKTLLVDLDIRKPDLHKKLGLENSDKGITNYLIGDATKDEILVKNTGLGYDVIFVGTVPPNPGELIRSEKMAELLAELKDEYDFIVIDTSPIGVVSDAYSLLPYADVSLFVARSGYTNKKFCETTLAQVAESNPKNMYTVLKGVDPADSYGYGYGYGYGNYHGVFNKNKKKKNNIYYGDGYYTD